MPPLSNQKRDHTDTIDSLLGIERPQPLFGPGDIPTWPGPVTSQVEPEREASGQDVLKAMREAREVLAAGEDESVFVGAVGGGGVLPAEEGRERDEGGVVAED